jgi:hypothetical protein
VFVEVASFFALEVDGSAATTTSVRTIRKQKPDHKGGLFGFFAEIPIEEPSLTVGLLLDTPCIRANLLQLKK